MAAPFQQTSLTVYQDYQAKLSPTALLRPNGAAFEAAFGSVKDAQLDRDIAAVKAKYPNVAPSDALSIIGADRGIPRGQSETDAAYAARLVNAWNTWPWAGTPYGMLQAFRATGYTNVFICQPNGGKEFTLDANGNLVTTALAGGVWQNLSLASPYTAPLRQTFWSIFDVLFPAPLPASWGGGATVPASGSAEANFIRSIVSAWKPGHAICGRIIIVKTGKVWGYPTTQVWGAATGNWGSSTTDVWTP